MESCEAKYGKILKSNIDRVVKDIETFCQALQANKVKDSKELFAKLPPAVQCLFLHHGWNILSSRAKHSNDSYLTAFRLFKLFRGEGMKGIKAYERYKSLQSLDKYYKSALEWSKKPRSKESPKVSKESPKVSKESPKVSKESPKVPKESPKVPRKSPPSKPVSKSFSKPVSKSPRKSKSSSSRSKSPRTKYDKEYQKYASPNDSLDPLFIYYTSLYTEKPDSPLAITWLTEHGVYDGEERKTLSKQYKKLADKGKLIK